MAKGPTNPSRCIFCGDRPLTKEHMWADWLRGYIPRTMQEHHIALNTFHPIRPQRTLKRRTGDPHSQRIKCVCRACNNGWMGKLQEKAKPFLVPMLEGRAITLLRSGQTTIAAWAAMMVMVAEYVDIEMVAIPASDRRFLHKHGKPPSRWRIWIGQHRRQNHELFLHNVMALGTEEEAKSFPPDATAPSQHADHDDMPWRPSRDSRH